MILLQNQEEKLKELIEQIPTIAEGPLGTNQKERDFAKKFHPFGREALPSLLPLLTDTRLPVRKLVNEILRGLPGKDDRELPRLFEAYQQGNAGVLFIISRIGSPKAMTFLKEQLKQGQGYFGYTVEASAQLGARFIPSLLELYREPGDEALWERLETLFGRLQKDARFLQLAHPERIGSEAVDPLLAIARDKTLPLEKRRSAIRSLGTLDQAAQKVAADLSALKHQEPELASSIESALLEMKAPEAIEGLRHQLRSKEECTVYLLRSIAYMGNNGQGVGPELMALLGSSDWELRWAAARALGYTGYRRAIPALIPLLKNVEDWRVVWASAESLGRLQAREATRELQNIAQRHWFSPVRETARRALSNQPYLPPQSPWEFFHYAGLGHYDPPKAPSSRLSAVLEIKQGKLVGRDNGEWGGTLELIGRDGRRQTLLKTNTHVITHIGSHIVALCGLAHLGLNGGAAYLIEEKPSGHWSARCWRILPGAPAWAIQKSPSQLEIACYGGQVLLNEDGSLRSIETPSGTALLKRP